MGAPTFLFALLLFILFINTTTATSSSSRTYKTYVKTACNSTTYPQICYKSLSSYATSIKSNPQKLCSYALSVTLKAAKTSASTVSKLAKKKGITKAEAGVVGACIETIKDSVDELKQSVTAMKNLGGADMQYQLDNIKTWVSASLTDEDTCTDGFDEQKVSTAVKNTIRKSILTVARLASNALSLIDNLNY
ncbi:PREDICTED: 21 kDa protein-like [Fragaria vesca subsp. vesca]|uniref:21 kDa protein-like n=1 Tax=Fragaria vesca subsp. vesca TaxID=101020 RepID=UPI0002C312BC|nr:PREDICTED: 21 kDa protein-like [Fragaria vesca subsp. vesca]